MVIHVEPLRGSGEGGSYKKRNPAFAGLRFDD